MKIEDISARLLRGRKGSRWRKCSVLCDCFVGQFCCVNSTVQATAVLCLCSPKTPQYTHKSLMIWCVFNFLMSFSVRVSFCLCSQDSTVHAQSFNDTVRFQIQFVFQCAHLSVFLLPLQLGPTPWQNAKIKRGQKTPNPNIAQGSIFAWWAKFFFFFFKMKFLCVQ